MKRIAVGVALSLALSLGVASTALADSSQQCQGAWNMTSSSPVGSDPSTWNWGMYNSMFNHGTAGMYAGMVGAVTNSLTALSQTPACQ